MFRVLLSLILGVAMFTLPAQAAELTRLANGLAVLVIKDDRFPLVSTRLYVHAGAAFEGKGEEGISHLLEHMVFKGTSARPAGAAARDVEAVGGYLNAYTSFDNTVYLADMPAAHWKLSLDVVKDMAFNATLDPQALTLEKDVVVAELQRGKDSPSSRIFDILLAETLKGTPYAHPIIGFENTIRSFTPQQMHAYIARYYQPQSMLLVVVGNIDPPQVLAEAERLFETLQNTAAMLPPRPVAADALGRGPSVTLQRGPWNKTYLGLALPVPAEKDMRSITLDVLAYLLAGDPGAYLCRKYKYERQLVHAIRAGNMSFERLGLFYIGVELDADKLEAFWKEFCADLAALDAERFTPEELAAAKLNLEDGIHKTKESLSGLASWKGQLQFFQGGLEAEGNILAFLRQIEMPQIQEAIRDWLRPERLAVAVLLPDTTKEPDLRGMLAGAWPVSGKAVTGGERTSRGVETIEITPQLRLILLPDATLPYIAVDIAWTGGDALIAPDKQGLASLAARILTTGTQKRGKQELERFLADRAANLAASADKQIFSLSLRAPTRFSSDLLALVNEVLANPAFAAEEITREKNNQTAAIRSSEDRPLSLLFRKLPPFLFPGHPYGYVKLGMPEQIQAFTADDIRAFWTRQATQPCVIAAAGDFDRETMLAFARSRALSATEAVRVQPPAWGTERELVLTLQDRQQAHYMLIFKTVPAVHSDAPGLELLESILSGQSGPLFTELRDKQGLAYTVAAFARLAQEAGFMAFYIGAEPGKLAQAETGFRKVLNDLHEKLLPAEALTRGINRMEADYYRERQSLASRSGEAAVLAALDRPLSFSRDQIEKARSLTPQDVQRLIRLYLKPENAYIAKVLP
ncbi:MAG: insulinase family protein [Desulfovibrionaceae bacterium]|nr:insulinase family protein [Desulfovibrionaceae bacterium]